MSHKLLIYNLTFPPDQVSTAYLISDIAKGFHDAGWKVTVFTSTPHYNFSKNFRNISRRSGWFHRKTTYYGIPVTHCFQYKSKNKLIRGLFILYFHWSFLTYFMFNNRPDIIFAPSPPLTSGFLAGMIGKLFDIRVVYNVQEVYPDILLKTTKKMPKFLWSFLKWIEKKTYSWCDNIVVIDEAFAERLKIRTNPNKICTIPNFVTFDESRIQKEFSIEDTTINDKFVLAYFGNLGLVQDWETILDAMHLLEEESDIVLLLIGGGDMYEYLENKAKHVSNITILPYQSKSTIQAFMEKSDLHIIAMNESSDYDGLPSKTLTILASGKPLLVSTSLDTPLANLAHNCGNAVRVDLGDSIAMKRAILKFKNAEYTSLSPEKGIEYVNKSYTKNIVISRYLELFSDLVNT